VIVRPHHLGLRHLALTVRDLEGFRIEWRPDPDNVYLSSGRDNLALHRDGDAQRVTGSDTALDHFGVIVRTPADVDLWAEFLEARGVGLEARPRTHRDGARSCSVRDPDGNRVQIIYHPPISDTN
jgi:catechol 2,3-dioxygenase-like lactoylglutathione lyase family enzyme